MRKIFILIFAFNFLCWENLIAGTGPASVVPTGGVYTAGAGIIQSSNNAVIINQSTLRGIVDWSSFSLGQKSTITFKNGSGATLNLVDNGPTSLILGSLISTGTVYLLNPAGVLIGASGRVNTGGDFVASTLNVSPGTFMQGGALDFIGASKAAVVNLGSLYSSGGSVFLIGYQTANSGGIAAANGTAGLAAGSEVLLKDSTGDQRIFVKGPGGDVTNSGTIAAAQVELRAKGGNIYALAGRNSSIAATGTATIDGKAWIVSDGGNTVVNGTVSAQNADGKGGSIETSGHNLSIADATVKTGQGGSWLLDPVDLTVNSAAASTIDNSLATTNVTLQTTSTSASGPGNQNPSGPGDIIVNAPISWASNQTLTLDAYHGVTVNSPLTSSGASAGLTVVTNNGGSGGYFTVNSPVVLASSGSLTINSNPYTFITNATALENMSIAAGHYYALDSDINLTTFGNFTPIANNTGSPGFQGSFEGLGHTLTGMTVSVSSSGGMFFFSSGSIENLILSGDSSTSTGTGNISSLVAINSGVINNVKSSGSVSANSSISAGGLVGENLGTGTITGSSFTGSVSANSGQQVGGLAGESVGTVTSSSSGGSVTGGNGVHNIAGLIGNSPSGSPTTANSFSTSTMTCGADCVDVAGLMGVNVGILTASYATGSVTSGAGSGQIGGLVGVDAAESTSSSYATGNVTCGSNCLYVGGFAGVNVNSTILNSYASGTVSVGTGSNVIGGLVGLQPAGVISQSYATGPVNAGSSAHQVGGLLGANDGTVNNSYATGTVTVASGGQDIGGLVGANGNTINNSYATGLVTVASGGQNVGGLVGENDNTVNNSYATGSVTVAGSGQNIGGLVGDDEGAINYSYSTGLVTPGSGSGNIGGFVGSEDGVTTGSYWDITTSGQSSDASAATGLTTAQWLTQGPVATSATGWDFANTWVPGYPYPVLKNLPYVVNSFTTSRTYGSTGNGTVTSSTILDQNGNNAASLVNGTLTPLAPQSYPLNQTVGTYTGWGGSGQTVAPGYQLTYLGSLAINPLTLAITGITAASKVYDGATLATILASGAVLTNLIGEDSVTLVTSAVTGAFSDKNVGTGKTVTISGLSLSGPQAADYILPTNLTTTANITPLTLTVGGVTIAANKIYDGTTLAGISGGVLSGVITGDSVTFSQTGDFSNKNAGTGKTVIYSNTLTGADAGNYTLSVLSGVTTANITPLTLTVGGVTIAANKSYDGTTLAGVSGGAISGVITGDSVTFSQTGDFSNKNAGTGKTVNYTNTLTGADAANYTLSVLSGVTTANITPLTLTDTFTIGNKTYDGTTAAIGTLGNLSGALTGDQVTIDAGSYQFTNANAGTGKTGVATGFTLAGADAGNYTLQLTQTGAATISPAELYYTASGGASRVFGLVNPSFGGSVTGFVGSDTLASTTTGSLLFTSPATFSSGVGSYAINGSGLTLVTGNYTLTQASSNASAFSVKPITLSIGSVSRTSGAPNPTFTISYSGATSVYLQQLLASLQLVSNAPASDKPGTYQITALVPTQYAADIILQPGTLTITAALPTTPPVVNPVVNPGASAAMSDSVLPAVLQSQSVPLPTPLPALYALSNSSSSDTVVPANAVSQFQVVITPSPTWSGGSLQSSQTSNPPLSQASFTEIAPDGHSKNDRSTYAAGAKQP